MKKLKLWSPGRHSGKIELVEELGINLRIEGGIYIRHSDGGSDTTTEDFLFDIPKALLVQLTKPLQDIINHQEKIAGAMAKKSAVYAIASNALKQFELEK